MVLVDVTVPSLGRTYDFSLDEQVPVSVLIPEMVEMICQKERCGLEGMQDKLNLCCLDTREILSPEADLRQYKIVNGKRLMLI